MSRSRRSFLKRYGTASLALSGIGPGALQAAGSKEREIVILHTNDMHSHIDPFEKDHPKYPSEGGMAYRAELIDSIRAQHENVLLLDAGDIMQGTPYFNLFGGSLEMKLMSMMGYDAATMGNHDFDAGMEGFVKAKAEADFPFLCTNYEFKDTPIAGHTKPFHIFKKKGLRIGVFGIGIDPKGLIPPPLYEGVIYQDPLSVCQRTANLLRKDLRCDMVICLSHLGLSYRSKKVSDEVLAQSVEGIDLIIGGHTHSFMEGVLEVLGPNGHVTRIHQVGWAGVRLGVLKFTFGASAKTGMAMVEAGWIRTTRV